MSLNKITAIKASIKTTKSKDKSFFIVFSNAFILYILLYRYYSTGAHAIQVKDEKLRILNRNFGIHSPIMLYCKNLNGEKTCVLFINRSQRSKKSAELPYFITKINISFKLRLEDF